MSQTRAVVLPKFIYVIATIAATSSSCVSLYKVGIATALLNTYNLFPVFLESSTDPNHTLIGERERNASLPEEYEKIM